jgi:uncharacterized membrane protein required for colicin V production
MNPIWPDLVVGVIVLLSALNGFKRGFVSELAGAVALFIAIFAAYNYNGAFDDFVQNLTHVGPGSSHVIGMVIFAVAVYLAVVAVAWFLGRIAKLPIINIGNAAGGAVVGVVKGLVGVWALLYVALFFPLTSDLRNDLRHSASVIAITQPNATVDNALRDKMPWFIRPIMGPLFSLHRL